MRKALILLLMMLPIKLIAIEIKIVADVNGIPISNLDIEKRLSLIDSLSNAKDRKELKLQILGQLVDEIIIINEAKRLNIKLSSEELDDATILFLTQSFKIKDDEVNQYVKKHNIDLSLLKKQIECQLLWGKIIEIKIAPFIDISDNEINDAREQIEKPDYLVVFQEFIVSSQRDKNIYSMAEDLVEKLRNSGNDFVPESSVRMRKTTVNLSHLKGNLRSILEGLEIGDVTGPVNFSGEGYSIIKVVDKVQLGYALLESTLKLKQVVVKDSEDLLNDLKRQKVSCLNFDEFAGGLKLPNPKEFEIKVRSLNPDLQALFSKTGMNEIVRFRENSVIKLIMLCGIKNNVTNIEAVKQQIYQQKIITQSNLLLESMRKSVAVSYQYN
ncbi:SurA N-terminal domain-containing protein [Wolbachia endosymbiont of Dirofilaria (Dirofilaria) immitis]|uniref:SurA N-terminal domain-containing protein n=1 Tax=Wolbachia endosymbiont of Dirofilaria (Dirofilaria) immitis TaxID=1812115 RepID=UPI00158EB3C6|nr:SurA N-terminal domain-containing protein [Wolbachia endosymbiont of Dirofilaria (Dirofilaria) immitis]QKX02546.1 peptidylprolyl isomerase [Wolbachia endosymbiont of Dirofilaria (Dirofilaria) immitis]